MGLRPNASHVAELSRGVREWNHWRTAHADERPDLRGAELKLKLLQSVDFHDADLYTANLWRANLDGADLRGADLSSTTLNGVSLIGADLRGANLRFARLVGAKVAGANFSGCHVYGCSIWNLIGEPAEQLDVVVTPRSEPQVTVDNLQIAQFVYLVLTNNAIRDAIEMMTSKAVLILGSFTPERKIILDAIRDELRRRGYLPMMFDFEPIQRQTITQTVSTLAHMVRFIIADITDPSSIPQELTATVPNLPLVPVQPILLESARPWSMFSDLMMHQSMLDVFCYRNLEHLLGSLQSHVIGPAEAKANEQFLRWQKVRSTFA